MSLLAFGILGCSLVIFLLSTNQYALKYRIAIWLFGIALLAGSALFLQRDHFYIARVADGIVHGDKSWSIAIAHEWRTVSEAADQTFGLFWVLAAVLAAMSAIAFTPGERLEKTIRPAKIALLGAMAGAFFALAAIAIGFGGYFKHSIYAGALQADDVHDGDTITFDDVSLRLAGIDAPELGQTCGDAHGRGLSAPSGECGKDAREHLIGLIKGNVLVCNNRFDEARADRKPEESFGRPIMQCFVKRADGSEFDLGENMVAHGFAFPFRPRGVHKLPNYDADFDRAKQSSAGIFKMYDCVLAPDVWRKDDQARENFRHHAYTLINPARLAGNKCR